MRGSLGRSAARSVSLTSSVASRHTGGATPFCMASFHRVAQRHQKSPGRRPGKPNWGAGDDKSLPRDRVKLRNSCGIDREAGEEGRVVSEMGPPCSAPGFPQSGRKGGARGID